MNILEIAIFIFIALELGNVCILYFAPDFRMGNGVAVFKEWENSKEDENTHLFAKYMVNWVAGSKLIFIFLLLVIALLGDELLQFHAVLATIVSIASYFFRLAPIMRDLDSKNMLTPNGYSKTLDLMIISFLVMFSLAAIVWRFF